MSWVDSIKEFVPSNEQERKDKEEIGRASCRERV